MPIWEVGRFQCKRGVFEVTLVGRVAFCSLASHTGGGRGPVLCGRCPVLSCTLHRRYTDLPHKGTRCCCVLRTPIKSPSARGSYLTHNKFIIRGARCTLMLTLYLSERFNSATLPPRHVRLQPGCTSLLGLTDLFLFLFLNRKQPQYP